MGRRRKEATSNQEKRKRSESRGALAQSIVAIGIILLAISLSPILSFSVRSSSEISVAIGVKEGTIPLFIDWLLENGAYISSSVRITFYPSYGGLGLQAVGESGLEGDDTAIHVLDRLYTIPPSLITTSTSTRHKYTYGNEKVTDFHLQLDKLLNDYFMGSSLVQQDVVIALHLSVECSLGEGSKFKPYLDIMPQQIVPRLDTFSDEALTLLHDDDLAMMARHSRHQLENAWEGRNGGDGIKRLLTMMINSTARARGDVSLSFKGADEHSRCSSFDSFYKYVTVVGSRAMILNGEKYLVPLPDVMNHATRPNNDKGTSFQSYHKRDATTGSITVFADRDVKRGNQIFEEYGDVDNSLFLEVFGFVPDHNPSHCAMIEIKHFPEVDKVPRSNLMNIAVRLQLLQAPNDIQAPSIPHPCVTEDGKVTDERIMAFLKLVALATTSFEQQEKCHRSYESDDVESMRMECTSYYNSSSQVESLISHGARRKICQSTSLEEDFAQMNAISKNGIHADREQMITAIKFRISDKRILTKIGNIDVYPCIA